MPAAPQGVEGVDIVSAWHAELQMCVHGLRHAGHE